MPGRATSIEEVYTAPEAAVDAAPAGPFEDDPWTTAPEPPASRHATAPVPPAARHAAVPGPHRLPAVTAVATARPAPTTATLAAPGPAALSSMIASRAPQKGTCRCPYDIGPKGASCEESNAYARSGGRSPECYIALRPSHGN